MRRAGSWTQAKCLKIGNTVVPQRIQRKRSKGWRVPPNTIYVGRRLKWENPYWLGVTLQSRHGAHPNMTPEEALKLYRHAVPHLLEQSRGRLEVSELGGKNLMCWCELGKPCHADVLLELANSVDGKP